MSDLRQRAETVLEMSKQLLALAEAGSWAEVASLERRRLAALDELFQAEAPSPEEGRLLVRTVEAVRALDGKAALLVERERDRAAGQLRKLQLGQQGERAYLAIRDE